MRLLYIAPHPPGSFLSGGEQRTRLLLSSLQSLGEVEAVFLPTFLTPGSEVTDEDGLNGRSWIFSTTEIERAYLASHTLTRHCSALGCYVAAGRHRWLPYQPLVNRVGDLRRYDLVVSRYLSPACMLDLFRHPRVLIDVDDYDPDRLRQRLTHSSWFKRLTLRRCLRFSEQAHHSFLPRATHCWISNPEDRRHPGLGDATLLPNIPYFADGQGPAFPPPPINSKTLLMVGTLSYSANSDGLDAFLQQAWPAIIAREPDAKLHIVGKGLSSRQRDRWKRIRGVHPIGFVESLDDPYHQALACIAPIQAGGGTNIKVLEAAAYGRVCVVTAVAHRGFADTLPDQIACLRAETIAGMAVPCLRLLQNPRLAAGLGRAAADRVNIHHTRDVFSRAVLEGCERALANRPAGEPMAP